MSPDSCDRCLESGAKTRCSTCQNLTSKSAQFGERTVCDVAVKIIALIISVNGNGSAEQEKKSEHFYFFFNHFDRLSVICHEVVNLRV